jgi:anti-sigma-K factor RskA
MTCEQLKDEYEFHALGLSEQTERAEIDNHLRNGCVACSIGVRRAMLTNVMLMQLAPDIAPSAGLRKRVLASIGAPQPNWALRSIWATGLATLALLIVAAWLGTQDRRGGVETAEARQTLAILNEPETRQVVFGNATPAPPQGRVLVNAKHGVLLLASNLPAPPIGKTYELWVIPKGGAPKPSGLFKSDARGSAMYLSKEPVDMSSVGAIAVTLEAEAGSSAPTSTPVIVAALTE